MTHIELVNRSIKWLKNSFHCRVVLSKLVAYTQYGETPDAIGWVNNRSILIECKSNRADFKADLKKRPRRLNMPALGHWRFYLTPPNLLKSKEIPYGWGLYEVCKKKVCYVGGEMYKNAIKPPFQSDRDSEVAMLLSALYRSENRYKENN